MNASAVSRVSLHHRRSVQFFFLIDFKLLPFLESREEQCPLQRVGAFLYNKQMFLTSIILHKKISCLFLGGVGVFAILKQSVIIT